MAQENQITEIKGSKYIPAKYGRQLTLQYRTYLKRAMVEALQDGFRNHPDKDLAKTKIDIEYATDRTDFPNIVVKWYEKNLKNAGVGHMEFGPAPVNPNYPEGPFEKFYEYHHRIYEGTIEFAIYGLSSLDRDKVGDAIVEIVAMGRVTPMGNSFQERVYEALGKTPYGEQHFISMNTDLMSGMGDQAEIAPWLPEDTRVYRTSYRLPILGEFYSETPEGEPSGLIEEVDIYPWDPADPLDTPPEEFPEGKIPAEDYIKIAPHYVTFTGNLTKESEVISSVSSESELVKKMKLIGKGIAEEAEIVEFPTSNSIKISAKALETAEKVSIKARVIKESI